MLWSVFWPKKIFLYNTIFLLLWFKSLWLFPVSLKSKPCSMCKIYRCREIWNADDSPLFRYETFIYFLTLVFRHEERERHTIFTMLTIPTSPAVNSPAWLARPWVKYQLTAFSKWPNAQSITSGHDVIHTPVSFPIWGFYHDICDCHILCAWVWTVLNVCAPALIAE